VPLLTLTSPEIGPATQVEIQIGLGDIPIAGATTFVCYKALVEMQVKNSSVDSQAETPPVSINLEVASFCIMMVQGVIRKLCWQEIVVRKHR
jgi:hypothetical protein